MNLSSVTEINSIEKSNTTNLNLETFRFVPDDLQNKQTYYHEDYVNRLNQRLFTCLQMSGKMYVSFTEIDGKCFLSATTSKVHTLQNDNKAMVKFITEMGQQADGELRSRIAFN